MTDATGMIDKAVKSDATGMIDAAVLFLPALI